MVSEARLDVGGVAETPREDEMGDLGIGKFAVERPQLGIDQGKELGDLAVKEGLECFSVLR